MNFAHRPGIEHNIIMSDGATYCVNSYHDDGVLTEDLADALEIIAYDNGKRLVEAVRHKSKKILGVQWHPERKFAHKESFDFTVELIRSVFNK